MRGLYCILLLIWLQGCGTARIPEPQKEDKASISNYLKAKKISSSHVLVVKDYPEYKRLSNQNALVIPNVIFFDSTGHSIQYKNNRKECSQDAYFFIKKYQKGKKLNYETGKELSSFLQSYVSLSGSPIDFSDKSKIYVFINWALFTDRLNQDSFNLLALDNKDFVYILLNLDSQKDWNR